MISKLQEELLSCKPSGWVYSLDIIEEIIFIVITKRNEYKARHP